MQVKFVNNRQSTALFYNDIKLMNVKVPPPAYDKILISEDRNNAIYKHYYSNENKVTYFIFNKQTISILSEIVNPIIHENIYGEKNTTNEMFASNHTN